MRKASPKHHQFISLPQDSAPTLLHQNPKLKPQGGFTLIEIMLSLALVGILASMAIPYFQEHHRTSQRTAAQAALMQLASQAEAHYSQHWTYHGFTLDPRVVERVAAHHALTVELDGQHYTLTATPLKADRCGTLQVLQDGLTQAQTDKCWR